MDRIGKDNVQCIRAKTLPEVVSMARAGERDGGKVVPMRPRVTCIGHRAPVVLEMPHVAEKAQVLQMPARRDGAASLRDGLRMTLVALFALLGWHGPTRGNSPGAGGLKPWKVERVDAISKLRIPTAGLAVRRAAYADEDGIARAA
jgi:hypothetical protein